MDGREGSADESDDPGQSVTLGRAVGTAQLRRRPMMIGL